MHYYLLLLPIKNFFLLQDETENLTSAPAQKVSEADFHRFLRTRKNIEMVQTKHCDD